MTDFSDMNVTNVDEHLRFLDAQIQTLERRINALKDRRGVIVYHIAKAKKKEQS